MNTIRIVLILLACSLSSIADQPPAVSNGAVSKASDPYSLPPAQIASAFARIRRDQVEDLAREEKLTVPKDFMQFFECAEKNDWDGTKNAWRALVAMMRPDSVSTNGAPGVAKTTNDVLEVVWNHVMDVYGFSEQVHLWDPGLLSLYATAILKDIPPGTIIFGGTDPGRFVLTAYLAVHNDTNRFLITQNALVSDSYMSYVRRMYGQLQIPSAEVCNNAFVTYGEDVRSGRLPPDPSVSVKDGRIRVGGVQGVMMINGILAKWIFDNNKDTHPFYVEESYVIPWMYPYLSPQGLIMKINPEPLKDLSPEVVNAERAFWDRLTTHLAGSMTNLPDDVTPPTVAGKDNELLSWDQEAKTKTWRVGVNHRFIANPEARKTFSKMRGAIGGLYTYRRMLSEAEFVFKQAIALSPLSTEANYRLADMLMQQMRFTDARRLIEDYLALKKETVTEKRHETQLTLEQQSLMDKSDMERARTFLQQIKDLEANENRRKELEAGMSKGGDINLALELVGVYGKMGMTGQMINLANNIARAPSVPPESILQMARLFAEARQIDQCAAMLKVYLERKPDDIDHRIELAKCYVAMQQHPAALAELQQAVRYGGDRVRERINNDSSLDAIRQMPELQEMETPNTK